MIKIKEAIIVEGRYDVNKIRQMVDTIVIETGGFAIFNNKEKLDMIRKIADKRGVLILTDSDSAGFVIRNYLKGALPKDKVKNAYIPQIQGKEHRKREKSKEGILGVEGMSEKILEDVLQKAGITCDNSKPKKLIKKSDFFELGLSGGQGSEQKRKQLLKTLDLPNHMTANALLEFINAMLDYDEFWQIATKL